jgi:hypothetical protein
MENKLMPMVEDAIKDTPLSVLSEINHGDTKLEVEINDETPPHSDEEAVEMVEVVEKELIPTEEIFKDITPVIKKPKRTRKMTPEALEKLALARAKGNETRKRNKELRMKGDMPTPTQKKVIEKEIQEEKKRPVVNNIVHKTENITNTITHEDIQKIVQESTKKTLEDYDMTRKARKEKKKKDTEEATQKQQVRDTIMKAQGFKYGNDGFYGGCF